MTTVHCRLVRDRIDTAAVLAEVGRETAGASVLFVGTTRSITGDVVTRSLDYEAHEPLAEDQLAHLARAAVQEFALSACAVVHRLGAVPWERRAWRWPRVPRIAARPSPRPSG